MITIWHNPRCSKSRQTLDLVEQMGAKVTIRRYLEDIPTEAEIDAARGALGLDTLHEMLRTGERVYRELGLNGETPHRVLLTAMAENPILIERPIVFVGNRAVIGRPPETVQTLF